MTAPQFFGAIVRAMGLYLFAVGITCVWGFFAPVYGYSPFHYLVIYVPHMIVGAVLMFTADGMVETCYWLGALRGADLPDRESEDELES